MKHIRNIPKASHYYIVITMASFPTTTACWNGKQKGGTDE